MKRTLLLMLVLSMFLSCAVRKTAEGEKVITIEPAPGQADTIRPVEIDTTATTVKDTITFQKPSKLAHGWRVQIYAFSDNARAELAYQDAKLRLNVPVYMEYLAGLDDTPYKIRVGNFLTRQEAEKYRDFLRENGYIDAFIVETQVEVP
ncbi:MAG TPA: SPOR domain-containing protein [Candidatus Hydrothermia bacterium]|nr:SPOR domain-containing protein [Candidatus Hydrothermia bacterium]MDD5573276.1 SPOR domain-containing protein [Candidatus Hydrothermia bacterium]HOK23698.1 SPOR domain-containing protein [Candidatus Hydrothermia bacterium]HOL24407.1 SPOR domain-containing protein [Candidatus Hydrothermia bacterium]HOP33196.1 SPOR domain-containing protein [Candidatus Hydrothermia bacterium]